MARTATSSSHYNTGSAGGNVPINKLYVTLLNAIGCKAPDGGPVTTFGVFDGMTATAGIHEPRRAHGAQGLSGKGPRASGLGLWLS